MYPELEKAKELLDEAHALCTQNVADLARDKIVAARMWIELHERKIGERVD